MKRAAVAIGLLVFAGCAAGGKIRSTSDVVRANLDKARSLNATRPDCRPREFALAEANLDFAMAELERGNWVRAGQHMDLAVENSSRATQVPDHCRPKQVLVRSTPPPPPPPKPIVVKLTPTDRDGDGIQDDVDKCPDDREDFDQFQDEDGCPEPDNDGDGVLDGSDRCPTDPGPVENGGCPDFDTDKDGLIDRLDRCPQDPGPRENEGCPKIFRDSDSDGIGDENDRCPVDPEDKDNFEDVDGCPDLDNDKDGLADARDKCPNDAGPVDNNGCPDLDQDGDRIVDRLDKCPTEFGVAEEQGCPKKYTLVVVKRDVIEIKQQVHFATNKAIILPDSFELLNQVAQVLKDTATMKIRVEGHTDNVGADAKNLRLSQQRADSVARYLTAQGVMNERLDSIGFGKTKPLASNSTSKGRAANRRVEFHIIER